VVLGLQMKAAIDRVASPRNMAPVSVAKCSLNGPICGSQLNPMPGKVSYQWRGKKYAQTPVVRPKNDRTTNRTRCTEGFILRMTGQPPQT
jgi:hypothetical protein